MLHAPGTLSDERLARAVDTLVPVVYAAVEQRGLIVRPERYERAQMLDLIKRLVTHVAERMREGQAHTFNSLMAAAGDITAEELVQLLDAVDWRACCDAVRLCDTESGSLPLTDSVLVLKTAPKPSAGPELFAVDSPAYPSEV